MTDHTRFWDRVARLSRPPETLGATARRTVEETLAHLDHDSVVLDVGCGAGDITTALAPHVASVRAIDTSPQMIEVARARAREHGVDNVEFEVADLATVSRPARLFSVVTAFNVLPYVEDVAETTRQVESLLAPGGLFVSATACLGERRSALRALVWVLTVLRVMPKAHVFTASELIDALSRRGGEVLSTVALSALPESLIVVRRPE